MHLRASSSSAPLRVRPPLPPGAPQPPTPEETPASGPRIVSHPSDSAR